VSLRPRPAPAPTPAAGGADPFLQPAASTDNAVVVSDGERILYANGLSPG